MSRIRSIHPGFFTDEELVSVSMAARLLIIGLGVEADDKGVFEWKPLMLKMRIFPADNVDMLEILAELVAANAIGSYEIAGRQYGAIRNFRKFQRPKYPNDVHPITDDFRKYVGLEDSIPETPQAQVLPFPQKGEMSPQMEDGGCRGEEKKEVKRAEPRATRLPKPFELPDEWGKWATTERRWAANDIRDEAARFADYWHAKPGRDGTKLDWQATWRNWVRGSKRVVGPAPPASNNDAFYASLERFQ